MKLPNVMYIYLVVTVLCCNIAVAATDGNYTSSPVNATWDGTYANLLEPTSLDYTYTFGDEEYLTYNLPISWQFKFYGRSYTQITADSNGNIWFGNPRSANSFQLPNANLGRVAAAWNDDLSSLYNGGVFIQHLTSPERVVVEWRTESYTDEGTMITNDFEVVLFDSGNIRYDYNPVNAGNLSDSGTGITKDDNNHFISVTSNYGSPTTYNTAQSIMFTPIQYSVQVIINGTGGGNIISNPMGFSANTTFSAPYQAGADFTLTATPDQYSLFSGWANGTCSGTGLCQFVLNADTSTTSTFDKDTAHQVNINGTYYPTIQAAYDAATDGAIIKLWATDYSETVTCGNAKTVSFVGGYDSGYSSIVGNIILNGSLIVQNGIVIANGLEIR